MKVSVPEDLGSKERLGDRLLPCAIQGNDASLGAGSVVYLWVWKDVRILSFVDRSREKSGKGHSHHGDCRLTSKESYPRTADLQRPQPHPHVAHWLHLTSRV